MKEGITIRDVASHAGVSAATVSRVLNEPNLVSNDASRRVRRAIDQLGYQANPEASFLAKKKRHSARQLSSSGRGKGTEDTTRLEDAEGTPLTSELRLLRDEIARLRRLLEEIRTCLEKSI